jgi:transcriptional regulator with XRE-family HTH domain
MEMKTLFTERFKSARLMNGFSLQDLADALDNKLSRQALHRYEKGEVVPDSEKINLLSKALKVTPDYFFRTTTVELANIEFRTIHKLPQKETAIVNEKTREYLSRYLELEEILNLSGKFKNPLENFRILTSYDQVNQAAEHLRKEWVLGDGPIFNIVELLEDKYIKIVKLDVEDTIDGLQTFVNNSITITIATFKPMNIFIITKIIFYISNRSFIKWL